MNAVEVSRLYWYSRQMKWAQIVMESLLLESREFWVQPWEPKRINLEIKQNDNVCVWKVQNSSLS